MILNIFVICSLRLSVRNLNRWTAVLIASGLLVGLHHQAHASAAPEDSIVPDTARIFKKSDDETTKNKLLEFSGFIKYDLFADTRQVVNAREGLVSMYPENRLVDASGNDVNAGRNLNMLSIHSRLALRAYGPVVFNARTSGLIEADFYGNENSHFSDLNGLRLFNAYINFNWKTTGLLVGQYWHPMSVREFFPNTVSFSAGAPFHPMSRNPQVRIRQMLGRFKLTGAFLSQRDFTSTGPDGPGSHYLRNAGIPNVHLQLQYSGDSSAFSGGAGIDYKQLVPTRSALNDVGEVFKSNSLVSSVSFIGFLKMETGNIGMTAQGVYAQNAYDLLLLGGYAEKLVNDAYTVEKAYTNLNVASFWLDMWSIVRGVHVGAFIGYTKNLGAGNRIGDARYSRGENIGWVYRLSPRMAYDIGPVNAALEGEYTVAGYGTANGDGMGGVADTAPVANFRSLLSVKYSF